MKKDRKKGLLILVIAALLAVTAAALILSGRGHGGVSPAVLLDGEALQDPSVNPDSADPFRVIVTLDGKTVADLPFGEAHRLIIRPAEGEENVLVLTGEAVYMESADCPGQDCVDMEPVTKDNMETRTMGGWIICLPHKVAVEVRER